MTHIAAKNKYECEIEGKRKVFHACTSRINLPEAINNHPGMEYIGTGSIVFLNGEECHWEEHPHHFFVFKDNPVDKRRVILTAPKD